MRLSPSKLQSDITAEWDRVASERLRQIVSGLDVSLQFVQIPEIMRLADVSAADRVIDVGCGVGYLSTVLSGNAEEVVAIDPSGESIRLAEAHWPPRDNLSFLQANIEDVSENTVGRFTLATANMVLMDVLDLDSAVRQVHSLLSARGRFVAVIAHPCFWPRYWAYESLPEFNYNSEMVVEADFRIAAENLGGYRTTHIHRPISSYVSALSKAGFYVDLITEPVPAPEHLDRFEQPWSYPRFLGLRAIRKEA